MDRASGRPGGRARPLRSPAVSGGPAETIGPGFSWARSSRARATPDVLFVHIRQVTERVAPRRAVRGFTLLELSITITVLVIGIGAVVSTIVASVAVDHTNREEQTALEAAQDAIESMKGAPFEEVFARFNAVPLDDPGVPGSAPGMDFAVDYLEVQAGDPDGFEGQVIFPGDGTELREDFVDAELGMPRDLNLDGLIDGLDHRTDYLVLPVRVRIQWTGENGNRQIDVVTTLANYR